MTPSTHMSLLGGLKEPGQREAIWQAFQKRYEATILSWSLRHGLQQADAEDVTQQVLLALYQALPEYEHNPARGRFRSWLGTVVSNALKDYHRFHGRHPAARSPGGGEAQDHLARLQSPSSADDLASSFEAEVDADLQATLQRVQQEVEPSTWQAFWRMVVDERPAREVAGELGMKVGAVYQAKLRVSRKIAALHGKPQD